MEPENKSLEKESPFGNHYFSGSMLNFGGVHPLKAMILKPNSFSLDDDLPFRDDFEAV